MTTTNAMNPIPIEDWDLTSPDTVWLSRGDLLNQHGNTGRYDDLDWITSSEWNPEYGPSVRECLFNIGKYLGQLVATIRDAQDSAGPVAVGDGIINPDAHSGSVTANQ